MRCRGLVAGIVLLLVNCPAIAAEGLLAEWLGLDRAVIHTEASLGYDDNASNAQHSADIESSHFLTLGARLDHRLELSERDSLLLRVSTQGQLHDDHTGLNSANLKGMARVTRHQDEATELSGWMSVALAEFNSGFRDHHEVRAGVLATYQPLEQIITRFGISGVKRKANDAAFDQEGASASIDLDWLASRDLAVYGGLQFYDGDVTSSSSPAPTILAVADARVADDVFRGLIAYRLQADVLVHTLGFNYGLSPELSLDIQAQYIDADGRGGNHYERWLVLAGLLARF